METKKPKDEDIKLWHRIFYNNVCAQIAELEEEIVSKNSQLEQYNLLKNKVDSMASDLFDFSRSIKRTYDYTRNGISCVNFEDGIEKINKYYEYAETTVGSVEDIKKQIGAEITRLKEDIAGLKAEITALKHEIGL